MKQSLAHLLTLSLLLVVLQGCTAKQQDHPAPDEVTVLAPSELVEIIAERLLLAQEVAWFKYRNNLPILDPNREQALLQVLVEQGKQHNLDQAVVESFFKAQFAASRQFQEESISRWKNNQDIPEHPPVDLQQYLRPALNDISSEMLRALDPISLQSLSTSEAEQYLRQLGFSEKVIQQALQL